MSHPAAKILKTGRAIKGLSQDEVAEFYGISRRTYQRWENGKSNVPYNHLRSILDDVFHLSIDQITEVANAVM